ALTRTGLIGFFDGRLNTVEDVKNPKPAPDLYLLAAARAGVEPAHCAVVEDSATGVAAARAAGMNVIGFTGSAHDPAAAAVDLNEAGAHILLEDMRALHTALDWM
ncbi:MAG: HAD-IA family hydrolase, partial [Aestuariivirgaceae bacterium]|nr:HAD-IA family hydrolase [Aestuariivirgaceae bacterium]